MNWGGFGAGLSTGFNNGVQMGKTVRDVIRESRLQDLREQGMAEAKAAQEKAASDMITEASAAPTSGPSSDSSAPASADVVVTPVQPPAKIETRELGPTPDQAPTASPDAASANTAAAAMDTPPADSKPDPETTSAAVGKPADSEPVAQATPMQKTAAAGITPEKAPEVKQKPSGRFSVKGLDGQTFETREEALAAAQKLAPSASDLFIKNAIPKIAEQYLVNGEPEKAKAWQDYAESQNGKRMIKDWAAAFTAPDFDTAVSRFGKFYTDHIDDGVDFVDHKMLTKDDGTKVAVVTIKNRATGQTQDMEITREKMLALAGQANPQHLFEQEQSRQTAAEKMKLEASLKAQEKRLEFRDKAALETYKQDRSDQREKIKSDLKLNEMSAQKQNEINTKIDALIGAGYGEEEIKKMMPAIVGAGEHKKTTDPSERRALIASDLMKNDPSFARKPKDQQNKQIDDMMGVIYGDQNQSKPAAAPTVSTTPMKYNPQYPVKYQKGTGKPFHLIDGQYVPIDGPVPPQASGVPKR